MKELSNPCLHTQTSRHYRLSTGLLDSFWTKGQTYRKNEAVIEASAVLKCGIESADFPIRNGVNFIIKFINFQKVHKSSQSLRKAMPSRLQKGSSPRIRIIPHRRRRWAAPHRRTPLPPLLGTWGQKGNRPHGNRARNSRVSSWGRGSL